LTLQISQTAKDTACSPRVSRRNLRRCPAILKESAYISLVRPTLEYAASVWDPHLAKDINKLENIQRRSARFVKGDYRTTSSVTQMLQELDWQDLQSRRRDLRLALYCIKWLCRAGFRHGPQGPWPRGLHQLRASTNKQKKIFVT